MSNEVKLLYEFEWSGGTELYFLWNGNYWISDSYVYKETVKVIMRLVDASELREELYNSKALYHKINDWTNDV